MVTYFIIGLSSGMCQEHSGDAILVVSDLSLVESIIQGKSHFFEGEIVEISGVYMLHISNKETRGYRLEFPKARHGKISLGTYRIEGRIRLSEKRDSVDCIEVTNLAQIKVAERDMTEGIIIEILVLRRLVDTNSTLDEWIKKLPQIKFDVNILSEFFARNYPQQYEKAKKAEESRPKDPFAE